MAGGSRRSGGRNSGGVCAFGSRSIINPIKLQAAYRSPCGSGASLGDATGKHGNPPLAPGVRCALWISAGATAHDGSQEATEPARLRIAEWRSLRIESTGFESKTPREPD